MSYKLLAFRQYLTEHLNQSTFPQKSSQYSALKSVPKKCSKKVQNRVLLRVPKKVLTLLKVPKIVPKKVLFPQKVPKKVLKKALEAVGNLYANNGKIKRI